MRDVVVVVVGPAHSCGLCVYLDVSKQQHKWNQNLDSPMHSSKFNNKIGNKTTTTTTTTTTRADHDDDDDDVDDEFMSLKHHADPSLSVHSV